MVLLNKEDIYVVLQKGVFSLVLRNGLDWLWRTDNVLRVSPTLDSLTTEKPQWGKHKAEIRPDLHSDSNSFTY